jgi:hypothetical protein
MKKLLQVDLLACPIFEPKRLLAQRNLPTNCCQSSINLRFAGNGVDPWWNSLSKELRSGLGDRDFLIFLWVALLPAMVGGEGLEPPTSCV